MPGPSLSCGMRLGGLHACMAESAETSLVQSELPTSLQLVVQVRGPEGERGGLQLTRADPPAAGKRKAGEGAEGGVHQAGLQAWQAQRVQRAR